MFRNKRFDGGLNTELTALIPPLDIVERDNAARLDFRIPSLQVGKDRLIGMVAIDVDPVEVIVWKLLD
jgi:hypothetical protein